MKVLSTRERRFIHHHITKSHFGHYIHVRIHQSHWMWLVKSMTRVTPKCGWLHTPSKHWQVEIVSQHSPSSSAGRAHADQGSSRTAAACQLQVPRWNVGGLHFGADMSEIDVSYYNLLSDVVVVDLNVRNRGVKHRISCKLDAIEVVTVDGYRFVDRFIEILQ